MTDFGALEALISQQVVTAMKAHDPERTGTLRLIKNALKNKSIEKRAPLTQVEGEQTLASMIKRGAIPSSSSLTAIGRTWRPRKPRRS